jgi:hypothetical protein
MDGPEYSGRRPSRLAQEGEHLRVTAMERCKPTG